VSISQGTSLAIMMDGEFAFKHPMPAVRRAGWACAVAARGGGNPGSSSKNASKKTVCQKISLATDQALDRGAQALALTC
jgi:hypothetical protein